MKIIKLSKSLGLLAIVTIISLLSMQSSAASPGTSITVGAQSQPQRAGPPWLDPAWHYRREIIINNLTEIPTWYQVLIALDDDNFPSFDRTKPDGSDVRLTFSDGITQPYYWIESWDNSSHIAYIWVRLFSISSGNTILYLYYGSPSASSASNGEMTFNSFDDDWSHYVSRNLGQMDGVQSSPSPVYIQNLFSWTTIEGTPVVNPPGILSLGAGTGIKSTTTYLNKAVGFRANFGLGSGREWGGFINGDIGQQTMIGDLTSDVDDLYLINYSVGPIATTALEGATDWHNSYHVYEVRWTSTWTEGDIDHSLAHGSLSQQVPTTALPVTLYSFPGSNATLKVDWVYVRQYRNPEPTVTVGLQQGLVDLELNMQDSPDPLPMNKELTYLLSIHNNSMIDAPGVIITDTLPANVQFVSSVPAGCSHNVNIVVCNLNTINANATASATIVVKPTLDGIIANHAVVDSLSYELDEDLADDASQTQTLVDSVPPNVNWVKPVQNGYKYTTSGGLVTLEASAADNDQVVWVEFWLWNHIPPTGKITILKDYTYPYQAQLNSDDLLVVNEEYQIFVQAADRAGNISDYRIPPSPVIYLERVDVNYLFLPITVR